MKSSLVSVEIKEDYLVHLQFSDGLEGEVNFSDYVGKGVFSKWLDYNQFRKAKMGDDGELVWDGDLDFCPDSLYMKITGQKPEEYFQKLAREHA